MAHTRKSDPHPLFPLPDPPRPPTCKTFSEGKGAQLVKCPPSDLYKSTARLPVHLQFSMLLCETYRYSYDTSPKAAGRVPDSEVPDQRLWCVEPSRMGWSSDVQVSELVQYSKSGPLPHNQERKTEETRRSFNSKVENAPTSYKNTITALKNQAVLPRRGTRRSSSQPKSKRDGNVYRNNNAHELRPRPPAPQDAVLVLCAPQSSLSGAPRPDTTLQRHVREVPSFFHHVRDKPTLRSIAGGPCIGDVEG
ncbi:hypothetical protein MBM_00539 [Drepanopeziza brunnea f. sp. 'multigermtubi' MB_m1]|uniref:Uncharacterized protein n=1 Tax=Marssonina brunnea f. sp. multigermtubi (strain MB_m1) TaxID=1072389 RepID=K1X8L1_MARBU|nr:uncharacterized protein MBM_00539 [Drepanopeziza brunnea f. sp. 'multigermtubi' MB_m1]EKD21426.1 hypothetical protein MBM_00539 [Drepanopeziza brunnea f. sp. 'multigermtubi' MB_m1]